MGGDQYLNFRCFVWYKMEKNTQEPVAMRRTGNEDLFRPCVECRAGRIGS